MAVSIRRAPKTIPSYWLNLPRNSLAAKISALPQPEDVPFEVNMNLIIEFYR